MNIAFRAGPAGLALLVTVQAAMAADSCVRRREMMALKAAAVQQQLMVAALTCHAVPRYNHFVVAYRRQLLASDNTLKAFFVRHGSVADYHAYKTRLANNSSLTSIGDAETYCRDAFAAFDAAATQPSLAVFVAEQPGAVDVAYPACADTRLAVREERRAARHRMLAQDR